MSMIVVQKFGGSSVADPEKLGQVADRVAATVKTGRRVVVVVSAMGKTTDELLALARSVAPESTGGPPRRELDMLLSTGERISMALLAMALEARGLSAISFTGSQSGILTNDRHSGARIIEVRPIRIEDELERDKVVIVAGFQGMSYKREITTLGRGGSDTTAVALAAALGADCEIYSDVDGVYSADPRVVPEAHENGVVIRARATGGGGSEAGETRIGDPNGAAHAGGGALALAVTGSRITRVEPAAESARALLALLAEERVALRHACPRCLRLSRDDVPDWPRIERRLASAGAEVSERGEVTLVGPEIGSDAALIGRALALAGPVVEFESAPLRLSLEVDPARVDEVTRALHTLCG